MSLSECERQLLRRLASMPLLDRLELAAVSGWSRGGVYEGIDRLLARELVSLVPHATAHMPPTKRVHLTVAGLHLLAREEGMTVEEILQRRPVSAQWHRILMERLDAVASIYRLASAAGVVHPIRFRWYRAMPMDASMLLHDGRVLAVVRQGLTSNRTAFAQRLWKLREGSRPSALLVMVPDEVRLRYARGLLASAPVISFLSVEREAVNAGRDAPVWHVPSGGNVLELRTALSYARQAGSWPTEGPLQRVSPPESLSIHSEDRPVAGHLLPVLLKPAEKRTLDLLYDWPWLTRPHLGALLGVERSRLSQILQRLEQLDVVTHSVVEGCPRHVLTDRGLALLARRDRTSVGIARQRWSVESGEYSSESFNWRQVAGSRSRQLVRHMEHTGAVHWFLAVLARQARSQEWDVVQLDPPLRASRYFRHDERLHSVRPDAFGILRRSSTTLAFFLEWERRAVRPATMAARLAPYLRYYSTQRPTDDHGVQPVILIVFDDELTQTHFLRVAGEEMQRMRVRVPLWVSNRAALEQAGPLGTVWSTIDRVGIPSRLPGSHYVSH